MKKTIFTLIAFLSFYIQYNAIASEDSTNNWSDSYFTLGILAGPFGVGGFTAGYERDLHLTENLMISPEAILTTGNTFEDIALFCGATLNITIGARGNQFFLGVGAVYGIPVSTDDREANITEKYRLGYIGEGFKITAYVNGIYDPFDCGFFGLSLSIQF